MLDARMRRTAAHATSWPRDANPTKNPYRVPSTDSDARC